jgi:hypothetical protein
MGNYTGRYVEARKPFSYAGRPRYVGEVFQLKGMKNDDKLWGLKVDGKPKLGRYTDPFDGDFRSLPKCAICGARFVNHNRLEVHGNHAHGGE